jgi:PAS domain S-box-containing protein
MSDFEKYSTFFDKNLQKVLSIWVENTRVNDILESHEIEFAAFSHDIAFPILHYYVDAIKDPETKFDNLKFVKYFRGRDIKLEEVFIIYSTFRDTFIDILFDKNINNKAIDNRIDLIHENNLSDLIKHYSANVSQGFNEILARYSESVEQTKAEVRESMDTLYKNVPIISADDEKNIIEVSSAFCDISGWSDADLMAENFGVIFEDRSGYEGEANKRNELIEAIFAQVEEGKEWKGDIELFKPNGEGTYWVNAKIEPIIDIFEDVSAYKLILNDISLLKELEEKQSMLVEQSKSAAMGEMISMIAHQWRQPLQAVSILVQKLPLQKMIEGEITDEFLDSVVDDVSEQLDHMSKTIDDFRDFFKPNKQVEDVLLSKVVDDAIGFLAYMFKVDSIDIQKDIQDDKTVSIHTNEVMQVLINIMKNARDEMLGKEIQNRYIKIKMYSEDSKSISLEFEDNAGGIPDHIIKKVFDPYFSTKAKNGTGLGLYMSRTIIVEHSHGQISAFNRDAGAVFKIVLPTK